MRRSVAPIYGLIFLETLVWIAMVPLAPTFAEELGLSGVETGMILASTSLTALVVALPLGQLADRIGARGVTIASALFTLATLGQGLANEFWTLLLARGAFGFAFGALWGAGAAWLSDSLTEERRTGALAAAATVAGLGFTTGPVFAGTVADRFDTGTPFLILAVAAAVVTVALVIAAPAATGEVTRQALREVVRAARRDELVLAAIGIIVLIGIVGGGVNLLVPLQLRENDVSAGQIGLLFSAASAIYTITSAAVARLGERSATLRVGGVAALFTGLTIVLVLASSSTLAAVAFILLRAPFWSTMDTIIYPLAAAGAHRSALGRGSVMGLLTVGWASASTVGPLIAGAIADGLSAQAAYAVMIACCAALGIWLLRASPRSQPITQPSSVDLDRLYGAGSSTSCAASTSGSPPRTTTSSSTAWATDRRPPSPGSRAGFFLRRPASSTSARARVSSVSRSPTQASRPRRPRSRRPCSRRPRARVCTASCARAGSATSSTTRRAATTASSQRES